MEIPFKIYIQRFLLRTLNQDDANEPYNERLIENDEYI
jgi:hypothetical protein